MSRDSFVGDAMSPSPYAEARAECERLRDRLAEEAMRNREMREERERLHLKIADEVEFADQLRSGFHDKMAEVTRQRDKAQRELAAAREALQWIERETYNEDGLHWERIHSVASAALAAAPAKETSNG